MCSSDLEIEVSEIRSGVVVNIDADGNWIAEVPGRLLGYKSYTITARTVVDDIPTGVRNQIATVTVIPWWWIVVIIMLAGLIYQGYRLKNKADKIKDLVNAVK